MTTFPRRITAVAGAAALVILAIWYFAVWTPQSKQLAAAHKAHAAAEAKVAQLDNQVVQLKSLEKQIPADEASLAVLEQNLPDNPQLDSALNQLNQAAVVAGVNLTTVGPSTPAGASGSSSASAQKTAEPSITLSLNATGGSAQVTSFLTQLSHMPRVLVIDHLTVSGASPQTAAITAQIFYAGQPTP